MVHQHIQKVKTLFEANKNDFYIAAIIFLVGMASFGLGRLSVLWPKKEPIRIINHETRGTSQESKNNYDNKAAVSSAVIRDKYVASKSGTAYHYPWCPGAQKIKEENKIWFQTKEDAVKAGYKPAGNCEGL